MLGYSLTVSVPSHPRDVGVGLGYQSSCLTPNYVHRGKQTNPKCSRKAGRTPLSKISLGDVAVRFSESVL